MQYYQANTNKQVKHLIVGYNYIVGAGSNSKNHIRNHLASWFVDVN